MPGTHQQKTSAQPLTVKLGGSLRNHLPDLVPVLQNSGRPLLIVPGGGVFADAVRDLNTDDETAHWMAVGAMDQYGRLIAAQGMPVTNRLQIPARPTVLLPCRSIREYDPLPHSWDITSDSIAAWIAGRLETGLVLLKMVDGIRVDGKVAKQVEAPVRTNVVDPFFIPYILRNRLSATIINGSCPERVADFLQGEDVPGTVIGTTF